jgi:hypothetical protein
VPQVSLFSLLWLVSLTTFAATMSSLSIVDPLISPITSESVEKYVPFTLWT